VHDFLMTPEGLELAALFPRIGKSRVRRRILDSGPVDGRGPDRGRVGSLIGA
jgi:hypothetical protein